MCPTLPHTGSNCELTLTTAPPTVKPDPPSNVTAWQVEGQETRMKVTWNLPTSWKHHGHFYKLSFELKYRPLMSSFHSEQVSNWVHLDLKTLVHVFSQLVMLVSLDAVAEDEGSVFRHHH